MATIITINRKLVKKFIKKLFSNPVKSHMERMHMWSSLKILIEDLRLSSNVAVTVAKKIDNYSQTIYIKIRYKASCHETLWK